MANNENEDTRFDHIDDEDKAALRGQGALDLMDRIRITAGEKAAKALGEQIAAAASDPLTAIEAKPPEQRSRDDWGSLYGAGRVNWSQIPNVIQEEMDMRA